MKQTNPSEKRQRLLTYAKETAEASDALREEIRSIEWVFKQNKSLQPRMDAMKVDLNKTLETVCRCRSLLDAANYNIMLSLAESYLLDEENRFEFLSNEMDNVDRNEKDSDYLFDMLSRRQEESSKICGYWRDMLL